MNRRKLFKTGLVLSGGATIQMAHMMENIGASDVKFTSDDLQQFNQKLATISIKRLRLPQAVLNFSNVEAPTKQ